MKAFLNEDFLLQSHTASELYHDYASKMPIIDYHCHINPAEIAQNRQFENITQLWLGGDHYKWRLIRANGTDERLITGDSSDYEKFFEFTKALPKAIGNPLYHWTHLELRRYFDCDLVINPDTAQEIWTHGNARLKDDSLRVQGIIKSSNVEVIATTDDPVDSLEHHAALKENSSLKVKVAPSFRPDKAMNCEKSGFSEYILALGKAAEKTIQCLDDLFDALENRIQFFNKMGCRASDHGLDFVPFQQGTKSEAESVFKRALAGETLSEADVLLYKTTVLQFLGRQYNKLGWVMQLHYGAIRSINTLMLNKLGPDTGYDAISSRDCSLSIAQFLDSLSKSGDLPKTILYSLNPNDDAMLAVMTGCFQKDYPSKLQHGSAWWFNDTKHGMEQQIVNLSSRAVLGNFVGMLTDSRSFLSYTRHEYFRRILCNLIGSWVENGEYPWDKAALGKMVQDISYNNAKAYFEF